MATVTGSTLPMTRALRSVRGMLAARVPFERVEAVIESDPALDEEEKAVLWLYAWFEGCSTDLARELGRVGSGNIVMPGSLT